MMYIKKSNEKSPAIADGEFVALYLMYILGAERLP